MWIFTDTGFISAVRKDEHPGVITVRARDRESLRLLAEKAGVEIKRSPDGDYPFRVFVGDGPFLEWFLDRGGELNYSNFKSRVNKTRGYEFAHALGRVWQAMLDVEDSDARDPLTDEELEDRIREEAAQIAAAGGAAAEASERDNDNDDATPEEE